MFPNVTGDTYSIKVTLEGFKTLERPNVAVSPGDRVGIGTLTVEVGGMAETVTVAGETPVIQSQSGERSFTVSTEAVENLPICNRATGRRSPRSRRASSARPGWATAATQNNTS